MDFIPTLFEGCFQVRPIVIQDDRGVFVKTFHMNWFSQRGLPNMWKEEYYSISKKNVIRGLHFQKPPHEHEKLVYCLQGRVLDVVVDLRRQSPTFGRHIALELDAEYGEGLMIPTGMAHGFLALTDDVIMAYKVTSDYFPSSDSGILWNSIGLDWGITHPIISERDCAHPPLDNFISPF